MAHYRVYKLSEPGGRIVKGKDLQAPDDTAALDEARDDPDCPVCEVWQQAKKVGKID